MDEASTGGAVDAYGFASGSYADSKIIARETARVVRKDMTAKC